MPEDLMQSFSIEESKEDGWTVRRGDRYQNKLGADECLYV